MLAAHVLMRLISACSILVMMHTAKDSVHFCHLLAMHARCCNHITCLLYVLACALQYRYLNNMLTCVHSSRLWGEYHCQQHL
jgi:hypothetical protein